MKHLLLLSLLLLAGCSGTYPSAMEALAACNDWKAKGGEVQVELDDERVPGGWYWHSLPVRRCKQDPAGLYLGLVKGNISDGERYTRHQHAEFDAQSDRILKRFRY